MKKIFSCKCCGHCCHGESTVSLSSDEQKSLASYLDIDISVFLERYCRIKGNRVEMKTTRGHCIFYGKNGLCRVHAAKPFHCRRWPLHPSILGDKDAWKAIRTDCPGFDESASYDEVCELVRSTDRESR